MRRESLPLAARGGIIAAGTIAVTSILASMGARGDHATRRAVAMGGSARLRGTGGSDHEICATRSLIVRVWTMSGVLKGARLMVASDS
ncbi:hypothetical protein CABS01_10880 [Colletotrichum abscissum]|nr:uncharacterized protein CABS01_10880 [Colletotrichum abscissum]KAK1497902.1 hypothetical protein CABS01_10880 [Colletotrichum abscissum]